MRSTSRTGTNRFEVESCRYGHATVVQAQVDGSPLLVLQSLFVKIPHGFLQAGWINPAIRKHCLISTSSHGSCGTLCANPLLYVAAGRGDTAHINAQRAHTPYVSYYFISCTIICNESSSTYAQFVHEALRAKAAWLKDRAENDRWTKLRKWPWGSTLPAIGSLWVFS